MPIGAQANEILRDTGYSDSEIDRLKQDKVVG
jgi:crotonobetainyl-CoA:carnitine CoA-transferase CaiB-like acyl-CoA transferase